MWERKRKDFESGGSFRPMKDRNTFDKVAKSKTSVKSTRPFFQFILSHFAWYF